MTERISEATDAIAQEFVESISYDWRLYKHDIAGSIAHATMLAKVELITDADRLEEGADRVLLAHRAHCVGSGRGARSLERAARLRGERRRARDR